MHSYVYSYLSYNCDWTLKQEGDIQFEVYCILVYYFKKWGLPRIWGLGSQDNLRSPANWRLFFLQESNISWWQVVLFCEADIVRCPPRHRALRWDPFRLLILIEHLHLSGGWFTCGSRNKHQKGIMCWYDIELQSQNLSPMLVSIANIIEKSWMTI